MNNQQIFDTIINHMRKQKYPSVKNGFCCYYDKDTHYKCAVGCLIPSEMYDSEMDNTEQAGIEYNMFVKDVLKYIGINLEDSIKLLIDMQTIHDTMRQDTWSEYEEDKCRKLAEKYNLVYTPPN